MSATHTAWSESLPALWLDASGPEVSAAWLTQGPNGPRCAAHARRPGHAGTALFEAVEDALKGTGASLSDCRGWLHACGPGSALGLRTVAMAVRSWQSLPGTRGSLCWAAHSTEVLAAALPDRDREEPFLVAVPQGRLAWAVQEFQAGGLPVESEPRRIPAETIGACLGRVFFPLGAKCWAPPPSHFRGVEHTSSAAIEALLAGRLRLTASSGPRLWPAEPPSFRKWERSA